MTKNYELNCAELLNLTNEISPHQRWLNSLITEVYKYLNELSADITNDVLIVSERQLNTRHYNICVTDGPMTDRYGRYLISYRANKIWNLMPGEIKGSVNLDYFKLKIGLWRYLECSYTLCKTYLSNLGYLYIVFHST